MMMMGNEMSGYEIRERDYGTYEIKGRGREGKSLMYKVSDNIDRYRDGY